MKGAFSPTNPYFVFYYVNMFCTRVICKLKNYKICFLLEKNNSNDNILLKFVYQIYTSMKAISKAILIPVFFQKFLIVLIFNYLSHSTQILNLKITWSNIATKNI